MFQAFLRICCGEGSEERKFGTFVEKEAYDRQLADQDKVQDTKERIQALEEQISFHSKVTKHGRRTIYATPVDLDEDFEPPYFEKSPEQRQFLHKALEDNFIFIYLTDAERESLIGALQQCSFTAGTKVIQQGEQGDFFYILEKGIIDFYDDEKDRIVGTCKPGGSFGELALLYDSPRAVSCIADSDSTLWKVDQRTFRYLLVRHAHAHDRDTKQVLRKVALFKDLDEAALTRFATAMTLVHWKKNDRIVQKGQEGSVFYIVTEGKVKIHDIGLGDSRFEDQTLEEGAWFGERALLTGEPRAANVTALTDVCTLAMDRQTFEECLGPLQAFIEKEMRKNFLRSMPIFANSNINDAEYNHLITLMEEVCYRKGEKLAKVGQPYQMKLWIIRHGKLLVYSQKSDKIFNLQSGDFFGDKSVASDDPSHIANHTAIVEENLTTWVLSREDIESVVGDLHRLGKSTTFRKSIVDTSIRLRDLKKIRLLGLGAFGRVWLVHVERRRSILQRFSEDRVDNESSVYALKMINKRMLLDARQERSVMREKDMLSTLEHPFILHLKASFQDEENLYLLLPLIPGGELFSVLHNKKIKGRGLPERSAMFYAACVIEALGHFHQRNIAYRDLKLENILIDAEGYCKIVDLGFAKVVNDKTYSICGTPDYIAPEIIMSKGHDKSVDYWAYGVLIYELLCGIAPFSVNGTSQVEMFKRIVMVKYRIPEYVDELAKMLIETLLVRNPTKRLGNLSKGHLDIKQHLWFERAGLQFQKLLKKDAEAPWKPIIKDSFDSSNFEDYKEEEQREDKITSGLRLTKDEQDLFRGF